MAKNACSIKRINLANKKDSTRNTKVNLAMTDHSRHPAYIFVLLLVLVASGCGKGQAYLLSEQHWRDVSFFVEVRPNPPKPGSNEFLVVATHSDGKPAYEYVISIKSNATSIWTQTIQDGHSGVFRRAIKIGDIDTEVLQVQLQSTDPAKPGETVLRFPIRQSAR